MHSAFSWVLAASLLGVGDAPAVPGGCSEPAAENQDRPGCYLSAELHLPAAPPQVYWHIHQASDFAGATGEAGRHAWSRVIRSHSRIWLYVLDEHGKKPEFGTHAATIGPIELPAGRPVDIRFIESVFPPGMQTRVHSHPGVEAFFVVEGEQCMETPAERSRTRKGGTYIVRSGPHVQTAPGGRRNLALLAVPAGLPWITLEPDWKPSDFCAR